MVNPDTVEAQIQSSIIFGLSAVLWGDITVDKGRVQQTNFDNYRLMRNNEAPQIDMMLVQSTEKPGGIGEPGTRADRPGGRQRDLRRHRQARAPHAVHQGDHCAGLGKRWPQLKRAPRGALFLCYACSRLERGTLASRNSIWSARMRRPRRIMSSCRLGT